MSAAADSLDPGAARDPLRAVLGLLARFPAHVAPREGDVAATLCLAQVPPRALHWLWPGRIPCGALTALLGPRGTGKSLVALDIAARVTRGAPWPDAPDCRQEPGSVLLVVGEDDLAGTVVPRLIAAGADLARVHALTSVKGWLGKPRPFRLDDLAALDEAADQAPDLRLLVIDPAAAFLGVINDRRTGKLATALRDLEEWAARRGVAVILVNATDRASTGKTWQYAADALPYLNAAARAVWTLEAELDEPGRRLFLPGRVNLGADPGGLRLSIERATGAVAWQAEPVSISMSVGGLESRRSARACSDVSKAAAWLRSFLIEGPRGAEAVLRAAGLAGHSRRALYAAKERLGVRSAKETSRFAGRWSWTLAEEEEGKEDPGGPLGPEDSKVLEGEAPAVDREEASPPRVAGPEATAQAKRGESRAAADEGPAALEDGDDSNIPAGNELETGGYDPIMAEGEALLFEEAGLDWGWESNPH